MAKAARGLPDGFLLDLPDERPVQLGDFLDEEPLPFPLASRPQKVQVPNTPQVASVQSQFRPAVVRDRAEALGEATSTHAVPRSSQQPSVIRYQLNLTPKSKSILEELVKHVRTYSPQSDARTSEVFQGIMMLLHNAMDEFELAELPKRGAWGSVTAKNFAGALSEAFEKAIFKALRKRGVSA